MTTLDPKYKDLGNNMTLTDVQVEGVEFLINRLRGILAFQTGLGKTVTSLVAMKVLLESYKGTKGIILCPVKAVKIFKKELKTKLGYKDHEIGLITNQEMLYDYNMNKIFIVTDTAIKKYYTFVEELAMQYKLILIIDEAHKLQDPKSGIRVLMEEIKQFFTVIWFATATPLLNDIESLYHLISFLDENFFGKRNDFLNQYTVSRFKDIYIKGGKKRKVREILSYKNLDHLRNRLQDISIMRQLQYNLKFGYVVEDLTPDEYALYEEVSKGIMSDDEKTFGARMHDLQRLVDNSLEFEYMSPDKPTGTKENMLIKSLKTIMDKDYSVVLYVDYIDTINRLEVVLERHKADIGYRKLFQIKGGIDFEVRGKIEEDIKARDIIIVTRAGTESINLQKANCVIMYDIPYSIKDCIQLIGRVTRMDTKHSIQYVILICAKGTIDEYKYLLFQDNAHLVKEIIGSDANLPESLTQIDRKNLTTIKNRLLWHYKDGDRKIKTRNKKLIKENIVLSTTDEMNTKVGTVFLNLCHRTMFIPKAEVVDILVPDEKDYQDYINGKLDFSILRNRFIDRLKTDKGKQVLGALVNSIINKNSVIVLVDDYKIGNIVKDYIINNVKL